MDNENKITPLSLCHYYKGGQTCQNSDPNVQMCWACEKYWVEQSMRSNANESYLGELLDEYLRVGLRTFEPYDNVPATLKAVLFNRYTQYNDRVDIPGFKQFYLKYYHK